MTDKELIKQEIERQIDYAEDDTRYTESYREGLIAAYQTIKAFIDSLPEEPASEDLDKLVISLEETIGTSPHSREVIKEHLQKAAEWGRNHFEDKSEMVSEDLEEAALKYRWEHPFCDGYTAYSFKAGAEWQKKKDLQDFMEKAEEFFYEQFNIHPHDFHVVQYVSDTPLEDIDCFVEQFKNYMKNEM